MSTIEQSKSQNNATNENSGDFEAWISSTGEFAKLPASNAEKAVYQFTKDKSKRSLVSREFTDRATHEVTVSVKARYMVSIPGEKGEKPLEVPKLLAQQIEANLAKNHTLLEITRHGTGLNTRYTVIAV